MDTEDREFIGRVDRYFMLIVSPVLIVFGTIGNLLSILVMSRRNMRSSNAAVYLITLAIADTGALIIGLLPLFLDTLDSPNIITVPEAICKMNIWLLFVTVEVSAWILVAFTIERFLSVFYPHKVKICCTQKSSIIVVICIVLVIFAHNSHMFYGFGNIIVTDGNRSIQVNCTYISDDYSDFFFSIYPWIDLSVNCFIPLVIFIVCNSFIATRVLLRSRKMHKIAKDKTAKNASRESLAVTGRQESNSRLTIMLFTVTMVFLITAAPLRVYVAFSKWLFHANSSLLIDLMYKVVYILMYVNNSINFILYCVTGSKFRSELRNMFKELWHRIVIKHPTNALEGLNLEVIASQNVTEETELKKEEIL